MLPIPGFAWSILKPIRPKVKLFFPLERCFRKNTTVSEKKFVAYLQQLQIKKYKYLQYALTDIFYLTYGMLLMFNNFLIILNVYSPLD